MDNHCLKIMNEYHTALPSYTRMQEIVTDILEKNIEKAGVQYAKITSRVKTADSLEGKLELKGTKYNCLRDITDIFGARISTLYNDEVDIVAAVIEGLFSIDWENSVDKRKMLESDRFGYLSLHYICRIPEELYRDESHPEINELRFEIQIRTVLQDIWATINHDIGYKTDIEIPAEYKRTISRLAGLLELADDEFRRFRRDIGNYRRDIRALVNDGKFDDISYSKDSFLDYIALDPFRRLNESIASSLKAEITEASMMPYFDVFAKLGFKTLGDIENMKKNYSEDAKRIALHRMAGMELDIMSSTVGVQNLCIVYILKESFGENGIRLLMDAIYGEKNDNERRVARIMKQAAATNII